MSDRGLPNADAQMPNALSYGLLLVPAASAMTGIIMLIANRRIAADRA